MGHYVHLSVIFACDDNDPVAVLARRHIATLPADAPVEATLFLEHLAARSGTNPGRKGGLTTWGIVGNYTMEEEFVEVLRPFWHEMLATEDVGPEDFEHVLVFCEHEQREAADAFEISYAEGTGELTIKHHERLPFAFMQF